MEKLPYLRFNFCDSLSSRHMSVEQIVLGIKQQIVAEVDFSGCRLPPVRVLAHQLGISKNSVQNAYDELKAQGFVESRKRSGLFVCTRENTSEEISPVAQVPAPKLISIAQPLALDRRGVINLSSVFLDPDLLPTKKLTECMKSTLKLPGLKADYHTQGSLQLREIIAKRLSYRGMKVDPKYIIITTGSQSALDIVSRTLQSRKIATENPAYALGKTLFELNGVKTIGLPIDPFNGVNLQKWEELIAQGKPDLLYLTTNFQNPNGYSYSSQEIAYIVQWSKKYQFGILEDDWGSDMLPYSEFRPGLRAQGGGNVLYMNSFTKKLLPSLRVGYIVANESNIDTLLMAKRVSSLAVPTIIEQTLFEFLDRGYYDAHLKYIQAELDQRYKNCLNLLRELMPENVRWTTPGGGPTLWLELPKSYNITKIAQKLAQKNILIQSADTAFFGHPHLHGFKVGYAALSKKTMGEALERLAEAMIP